jgi:aspartate aminotransferase
MLVKRCPNTHLSTRAKHTPSSPIRRLAPLAQAAKAAGKKVYHLNIGQPDIPSPVEFFAGLAAYKDTVVAYEMSAGSTELRVAWAEYINRSLGLETNPEEYLITVGASEALIFVFMICCDPGDEIIVFDPTYANYLGFAAIAGVHLTPVTCSLENAFHLPAIDIVERAITQRTRAILLCNPNNPTGTVYTEQELRGVVDLCNKHGIFLIVDETYREYLYTDGKPRSILHLDQNNERFIVIDSISKRFSLCGARIGCLYTKNKEVQRVVLNLASSRLAAPSIEQFAVAHMLRTVSSQLVDDTRKLYRKRRDVLVSALKEIPGVSTYVPEGAFYTLTRLPIKDGDDFCSYLLRDFSFENETVFVAPAKGFYLCDSLGDDQVRIAYVLNESDLSRAIFLLGEGLREYQKTQC